MNDNLSRNIAGHLPGIARSQPDSLGVVIQRYEKKSSDPVYTEISCRQLDDRSTMLASGLRSIGIGPAVRTILMVKPSIEFFELTFALFKAGAVPVFVDPGMGIRNLKKCLAQADPQAFIGITKAHIARKVLGWCKGVKKLVTVGRRLFWTGYSLSDLYDESTDQFDIYQPEPNQTAAILFTSGSTGIAKGAVYTHEMFNAQVNSLKNDYMIEPGERDLATFPLFALFGPALGMTAVIPDMDASRPITTDPTHIIRAANDYQTTNMFASPALIEVVGRYGYDNKDIENKIKLSSLKRVISAGAPADPESLKRFSGLLEDGVEVLTSYGATESLPVAFIGTEELLNETADETSKGAGVCVGYPVKDIEVRVIRITDEPIETWSDDLCVAFRQTGEIAVKGPVVSPEYFMHSEGTLLAKIKDPAGGFYHRMGDLGYLDDKSRLWMCGRKSHRVKSEFGDLFTVPIERIFNNHPDVKRTALVGIDPLTESEDNCQLPVLCVELNEDAEKSVDKIKSELHDIAYSHDITKNVETFVFHKSFPVDVRHNAKIFREELAVWASKQVSGRN